VIDPDAVAINPLAPPVLIEDVQIDRQSVPNGIFQSAIRNLQSAITLSPGQTNLDIHYTGLSFINSAQVRFKYKLEGLDADWNEVGTRRAAYYSYLPPGEYTFRVTAANRDGVWNEESASVRIIVRPHFYQTWWFWSLVIAGLFGVTLLGFKLRVNQVERARALQEAFSRRLMDSQEQERQRIAAELHDSLGQSLLVIKNRAALAKLTSHDLPAAFQQLDQIADSTTHAIQEVRQIAYNLRPHHLDNIGLTRSLEELLRRVEETSGLGIAYDIAPLDGAFPKEAEINCYRIVQEAISNIIKHAQATRAGVEIEREPERLLLTIRDNGCGFVVQEPGERRGFGLARMAERARLLGGSYRVESAPGKGTTVVVELPLAKQEPKP
jgi:signal transduction histidine kinase